MWNPKNEAERWLKQAENDFGYGQLGLRDGYYAQACFIFQQVAEKAVKSIHYYKGKRFVVGHSVFELLKDAGITAKELLEYASLLDQYYIPTRYPNGLPGGVPFEVYTQRQAEIAAEIAKDAAEKILELAKEIIK